MIGLIHGMQPNFICPKSNHPYQRMWLKLSTPILVMISPFQRIQPNFNWPNKWLPLSKNATRTVQPCPSIYRPCPRNVIEFWSPQEVITPIQECNRNCLPLSRYWLTISKECNRILVGLLSDYACPSGVGRILVILWTSCNLNSIELKWWESVITINLNSNSSTKLNLNINWPLPSYYIISSTLFCLPQWVPNLLIILYNQCKELQCTIGKLATMDVQKVVMDFFLKKDIVTLTVLKRIYRYKTSMQKNSKSFGSPQVWKGL